MASIWADPSGIPAMATLVPVKCAAPLAPAGAAQPCHVPVAVRTLWYTGPGEMRRTVGPGWGRPALPRCRRGAHVVVDQTVGTDGQHLRGPVGHPGDRLLRSGELPRATETGRGLPALPHPRRRTHIMKH